MQLASLTGEMSCSAVQLSIAHTVVVQLPTVTPSSYTIQYNVGRNNDCILPEMGKKI